MGQKMAHPYFDISDKQKSREKRLEEK